MGGLRRCVWVGGLRCVCGWIEEVCGLRRCVCVGGWIEEVCVCVGGLRCMQCVLN